MKLETVDERRVLALLQRLISIESVNPLLDPTGSGEEEIGRFLREALIRRGFEVHEQTVQPGRANIIGRRHGDGRGPSLLLNGHMDTVGISSMDIPPLTPALRDGRILGRGSADMKSGIAAILEAADILAASNVSLAGDLILAFVVDEEYTSLGTQKLLETVRADAAIVCEPTDLRIGLAHKGFVWGKVDVEGRAAHGSRPAEGIDAIVAAGRFLGALDDFGRENLSGRHHPLLGCPSVHASLIRGGREMSTYPDHCEIRLERRTLPGETASDFTAEITTVIDRLHTADPTFKARYTTLLERPPLESPAEHPLVSALAKAHRAATGRPHEIAGISWWMDTALISDAGVPAVAYGPQGDGLHGARESVDFESVLTTAAVLARTALGYCGG